MKRDALNRRSRFAPPQPVGKTIELEDTDYLIFQAIDRHGPLPAPILFEYVRHKHRSYGAFQHRLTKLYNGSKHVPSLLSRPPQQFAGYEARYQPIFYDLLPVARTLLGSRATQFSPPRTDAFLHRAMTACVTASIEIACRNLSIRYIPREEVLAHANCPDATRFAADPLAIPVNVEGMKAITPDDIFGFQYPNGKYRFFALEVDRKTESIERKNPGQNTFGKKVKGYFDILDRKIFGPHFGLPNLTVLTVTTNEQHALNIAAFIVRQDEPRLVGKFLFKVDGHFTANWRVPRQPLMHLLREPWMRAGNDPIFISEP
jgi:hypothetical protein